VATPDFILSLRQKIGHDPLWLPGVTALVTDDDGRVLLGRRADFGTWAMPAGLPEPGEPLAVAIAREVLEETGVRVSVDDVIALRPVGPVTYPNGDVCWFSDTFFRCRALGGEAHVADEESTDVGWFAPGALPEPLRASVPRLLAMAEEQAVTGRTVFDT
jgi:8-oxo-dGTP pyrophosphatase MutT (NUDIX family)